MCKDILNQAKAKASVRQMAGKTAKILAVYENIDGRKDLIGFFASFDDEANLFEVNSKGEVKTSNYIARYSGMGRRRIAHMFSPMGYAIPC